VAHLEECLAEFKEFMRDVAQGKIAVEEVKDHWQSYAHRPDGLITAVYADRLGPVIDFQKHQNKNPFPMIYDFTLNAAGYITRAEIPLDAFSFDEKGRLRRWHGENEPYTIE
jgi:hypothetical protein